MRVRATGAPRAHHFSFDFSEVCIILGACKRSSRRYCSFRRVAPLVSCDGSSPCRFAVRLIVQKARQFKSTSSSRAR